MREGSKYPVLGVIHFMTSLSTSQRAPVGYSEHCGGCSLVAPMALTVAPVAAAVARQVEELLPLFS